MSVGRGIERPLLDDIIRVRSNAQCMVNRLVEVIYFDGILYGFAGTLIGSFAKNMTSFDKVFEFALPLKSHALA